MASTASAPGIRPGPSASVVAVSFFQILISVLLLISPLRGLFLFYHQSKAFYLPICASMRSRRIWL